METAPKLSFDCSHCDYKGFSHSAIRLHFYRNHYKDGFRESFKRKVALDRSTRNKKNYEKKTKQGNISKLNHYECSIQSKEQADNNQFKYEYEIANERESENKILKKHSNELEIEYETIKKEQKLKKE